jgi:hypothetical protein
VRHHHSVAYPELSERSTKEHSMMQMWLRHGEESSQNPPIETLPKHPVPTIPASMSDLGNKSHEVHKALLNRMFSEAMSMYLMLRQQSGQKVSCNVYVI